MKTFRSFLIYGLLFSLCLQFFASNVLAEDSLQHSPNSISAGVSLTPLDQSSFIALPGSRDYTLTLQNTGTSGADTFTPTIVSDWPVAFFESDGTTPILDPISLDQGQTKTMIARVVTPLTEEIGGFNTATVTFTSALDISISASVTITSTIPAPFAQFLNDQADETLSSILVTSEAKDKIPLPSGEFTSSKRNLAVAELPNTNLVYVWTERVCVDQGGEYCYEYADMIAYMIRDHTGEEVLAARLLDDLRGDANNPNDYTPYLTVAPNGNIGVLWYRVLITDTYQTNSNIYFSVLSENGAFILEPVNITNNSIFGSGNGESTKFKDPRLATTTDGRYFLTWLDGEFINYANRYDIYYAVLDVDVGAITVIKSNTKLVDTSVNDLHYTLTALSGARMIVFWYMNSDLSYQVLDSNGAVIDTFGPIYPPTHFIYPDAIQLSDGNIILAGSNSGDICYQFFDGGTYAALLGEPACLSPANIVSVTRDDWGHAILTWQYNLPGYVYLYYALLGSDGTVVSPPTKFYSYGDIGNAQYGSRGQGLTTYQHAFAPYFTSTPNSSAVEGVAYLYAITTTDPDLPVDIPTITASIKPDWLVFTDNADGSATLSGTPATSDIGAHPVELMVEDSTGKSGYQAFTINVTYCNTAPSFTSTSITTATQDALYTYNVIADDGNLSQGDTLSITASPLPGWLTLTDHGGGTATLSGTPLNAQVGDHNVKLVVTDSHGLTDDQEFTITVDNVNDPPEFTSVPVTAADEGVYYIYNIIATDPDLIHSDTLVISAATKPNWLTLVDNGNGSAILDGTPGSEDGGDNSVILRVTDGSGAFVDQSFTISVAQTTEPPTITSMDTTTFTVGTEGGFDVTATGQPLPLITMDETLSDTLPDGLGFVQGSGSARLSGTPAAGTGGVYELVFVASNGIGSDATQVFTLTLQTLAEIDGQDGSITSNDGEIEIIIPAGAVPGQATFTLVPQGEPTQSTGSFMFAGVSFTLIAEDAFGAPITEFDEPLIVTITYDLTALGEIDPSTLKLYYWDGAIWEDAICDGSEYTRNLAENWFSLPICHLSEFAVLGNEASGFNIFLPLITR